MPKKTLYPLTVPVAADQLREGPVPLKQIADAPFAGALNVEQLGGNGVEIVIV